MSYQEKYLKYKLKYLNLKNKLSGGGEGAGKGSNDSPMMVREFVNEETYFDDNKNLSTNLSISAPIDQHFKGEFGERQEEPEKELKELEKSLDNFVKSQEEREKLKNANKSLDNMMKAL